MKHSARNRSLIVVLMFWLLVACGQAAVIPTLTPTLPPTATPTDTPTPTSTPIPSPTPTPGPLSASQIFELVSPSVVYIETEMASGSGILIAGGYVVTNAHVVYPYRGARLVFPDGSEYLDTPVISWDLTADLTVLGPIETTTPAVELVDGEGRLIGSDAYLVGYPGETDGFPTPTITRGLISRLREWEATGITYFQSDAAIAGGQSGGVLVSDRGEVVGISGYRFTEAGYAIVASAADITARIEQIIAKTDVTPEQLLNVTRLAAGKLEQTAILDAGESRLYTMDLQAGQQVNLEMSVTDGMEFTLLEPDGYELMRSTDQSTAVANFTGPHFLIVENTASANGLVRVSSNRAMTLYKDAEDGMLALRDITRFGKMDYAGDIDYFYIPLVAGDFIRIKAQSVMIDTFLSVGYYGAGEEAIAYDDDTGRGMFGLDAELAYFAPHTGSYWIGVEDSYGSASGGYLLTVEKWAGAGPTPFVPPSTPTPVVNELGEFTTYFSPSGRFSLQYLAEWRAYEGIGIEEGCPAEAECLASSTEDQLLMLFEFPDNLATPEEFADYFIANLPFDAGQPLSESRVTESGVSIRVVEARSTQVELYMLVYVDDQYLFAATYVADSSSTPPMELIADYTFNTFARVDN